MWKLSIANGIEFTDQNGRDIQIKSKKARAILAYLYLGPSQFVTREKLCGLLWGEKSENTARAALRQCLKRLQEDLSKISVSIVRIERDRVATHTKPSIDIDELINRISNSDPVSKIPAPETLFYGFDDIDDQFTAWIRIQREKWTTRLGHAVNTVLNDEESSNSHKLQLATAQFELENTHENAARQLIRDALDKGDPAGAMKFYKTLWNALDEEWGEEPSQDIQGLIIAAKQGETETRNISNTLSLQPPMILVQPFERAGPWNQPDYFVEGFRRELIATMVRFREWNILDGALPTAQPADFVLTGGYQENGRKVELTITMLDLKSNSYIISDNLNINLDNWATSLRRVIRKAALSLNVHLARSKVGNWIAASVPNASAYNMWLRAEDVLSEWSCATFDEAEGLLIQVIEQIPDYSPALSTLAGLHSTRHLTEPGIYRSETRAEEARKLAARSVALDPLDTRNQHALAWAYAMKGVYSQAEFHFELSLDLNDISPYTLLPSAHGFSFLGDHQRAVELTQSALSIYPSMSQPHWGYIMCINFLAGNYEASAEAGELAGDSILDLIAWHAAALAMAGKIEDAKPKMETFLKRSMERWHGQKDPTPADIGRWLVHAFPIRKKEDYDNFVKGLQLAGLESV